MFRFARLLPCESALQRAALVLALGSIAAPYSGHAAEGPLTLEEMVQIAQKRSAQLAAQDAAVVAAREMSVSAGQLPDPVLRLGVDNVPVDGEDRFSLGRESMTTRRIGVSQEFTREEKRRLRGERGAREAERETAARQVLLADVRRDATLAWIDRYYAERTRALLDQIIEDNRSLIAAVEAAYRGGRGSQGEVFAARAALVGLQDRRAELERKLQASKITLARWIGPDAERPLAGEPEWQQLDLTQLDERLNNHPQLGVLAKQVEIAEADARLARAASKPDWSVEFAYGQRGPAFANLFSIGLSIPLPIRPGERQDRDVAAKLALAEQARARLEDGRRMHAAEIRTMLAEWRSNIDRLTRLQSDLIPVAAQRTDAALAAYRGNTGGLSAVLDARRGEREALMQVLELTASTARVWAQLLFLLTHPLPSAAGATSGSGK